jgi:hypothetical protein
MLAASRLTQLLVFLAFSLLIRFEAFGEWNYDVDEQFYALVGRRLLAGDTLYVDIWDRKGPLLYWLYAAIAAVSPNVIAYQIVATAFAAAGAFGTAALARLISSERAAAMAGIAYCAMINHLGGDNGQSPVFYNPLVIAAAWSVASSIDRLRQGELPKRVLGGMLCAGLAIAIKQSAVIEGVFFGMVVLVMLRGGGAPLSRLLTRGAFLAIAGALPILLVTLWYWRIGHFAELWQALVTSNFNRIYDSPLGRLQRVLALSGLLGLPLLFAIVGYRCAGAEGTGRRPLGLLALWAIAATGAVAIYPNIYLHYALTLVAPLCVLGAAFFDRPQIGTAGFVALVTVNLALSDSFDIEARQHARAAASQLVSYVRQETPGGDLLVWGAPSYLYAEIGTRPPSRLALPAHFYEGAEAGASGIDEVAELRRILATGPQTVVVQESNPPSPPNTANILQVQEYVRHCRRVRRFTIYDRHGKQAQAVYSACKAIGGARSVV